MLSFDDAGEMFSFMLLVTQFSTHMHCTRFLAIEAACLVVRANILPFVSEDNYKSHISVFTFNALIEFYLT